MSCCKRRILRYPAEKIAAFTEEIKIQRTDSNPCLYGGVAILSQMTSPCSESSDSFPSPTRLLRKLKLGKKSLEIWNPCRTPALEYTDSELPVESWPSGEDIILGEDINCLDILDQFVKANTLDATLDEWLLDNRMEIPRLDTLVKVRHLAQMFP